MTTGISLAPNAPKVYYLTTLHHSIIYGGFPCTSPTLGVPTQVHRMILGIVDVAYQGSDCGNQSSTDDAQPLFAKAS